jgi:drug/metabolite transporter (DMT)-like permease
MPHNTMHILGLLTVTLTLGAGQLLFKIAAGRIPAIGGPADVPRIFTDPVMWIAIVVYVFATVLWVALLQRVPLSYAYPFISLAFVIVPLAAAAFLGEKLSLNFFLGSALIIGGIWLTSVSRA